MTYLVRWLIFSLMTLTAGAALAQDEAEVALETANNLAAKGKLSEAVPYYKKVLELDPQAHPLAYFNLAEVQKARGNCNEAVLMLQLYASMRGTPEAKTEVQPSIKKCKADKWPKLAVKGISDQATKVKVNGFLASVEGKFGPAALPPGTYVVQLEAVDHHPVTQEIVLGKEDVAVEKTLEKMTFNGKLLIQPSVPGARIRIFEGPSDQGKVLYDLRAPMTGGVELLEGRYFVEVTAKGHDRWIRNVSVSRDDVATIDVALIKARPPELN